MKKNKKNKLEGTNCCEKEEAFNYSLKDNIEKINEIKEVDKNGATTLYSNEIDIFSKLLEAREQRVELIKKLNEKFKTPIICIRANYPGLYKTNDETISIVGELEKELRNIFSSSILYDCNKITYEGPVSIFVVQGDSHKIKIEAINLEENHMLGRLADIDVYDESGIGISRSELNFPSRKCFLCEKDAHICVRSKAHKTEEIEEYIRKTLEVFKKQ